MRFDLDWLIKMNKVAKVDKVERLKIKAGDYVRFKTDKESDLKGEKLYSFPMLKLLDRRYRKVLNVHEVPIDSVIVPIELNIEGIKKEDTNDKSFFWYFIEDLEVISEEQKELFPFNVGDYVSWNEDYNPEFMYEGKIQEAGKIKINDMFPCEETNEIKLKFENFYGESSFIFLEDELIKFEEKEALKIGDVVSWKREKGQKSFEFLDNFSKFLESKEEFIISYIDNNCDFCLLMGDNRYYPLYIFEKVKNNEVYKELNIKKEDDFHVVNITLKDNCLEESFLNFIKGNLES